MPPQHSYPMPVESQFCLGHLIHSPGGTLISKLINTWSYHDDNYWSKGGGMFWAGLMRARGFSLAPAGCWQGHIQIQQSLAATLEWWGKAALRGSWHEGEWWWEPGFLWHHYVSGHPVVGFLVFLYYLSLSDSVFFASCSQRYSQWPHIFLEASGNPWGGITAKTMC